ncbi:MAG: permease [Desulfovibrio sp.]|nr:MAG: permease [Desulfovibrio sp.]
MTYVFEILGRIGAESWLVLEESAIFLLFGFLVAGVAKALLPDKLVAKHLGGRGPGSVIKASLIGAPIPLCSCGVLPAAAGLRKQGASRGATAAFLVSTPETGADSIAVTYALLDPVMALIRPLAALFTATLAGIMVNLGYRREREPAQTLGKGLLLKPVNTEFTVDLSGCGDGCDCPAPAKEQGFLARARMGLDYAFGELLGDIGKWLIVGVLLAGIISAVVPESFIRENLSGGAGTMLLMLLVSVPLYVCATSSTPIAAALVLKGLSPGAALVFLLAGPATNAATLTVSMKVLGKRGALLTLAAIVVSTLLLGLGADALYSGFGWDTAQWSSSGEEHLHGTVALLSAVLLLGLIGWNLAKEVGAKLRKRGQTERAVPSGVRCEISPPQMEQFSGPRD